MAKRQCTKCSGVISSANIEVATPKLRRRSVSVGVAQGIGRERRPLWPVVKGDLRDSGRHCVQFVPSKFKFNFEHHRIYMCATDPVGVF